MDTAPKVRQENPDFCRAMQRLNPHRSLFRQHRWDRFIPNPLFAYTPWLILTRPMLSYIYFQCSCPIISHQKLLNTHPSSSQKNKHHETKKRARCQRQSRKKSKKAHRHLYSHLSCATLKSSALQMPFEQNASSLLQNCHSPAQIQSRFSASWTQQPHTYLFYSKEKTSNLYHLLLSSFLVIRS